MTRSNFRMHINEVLNAFAPIAKEIHNRGKKNKTTPLDRKIINLLSKINESRKSFISQARVGNFTVTNTHLSQSLTLADFKIALECCPEGAKKIITHLGIKKNLDKLDELFPILERIHTVSEKVLAHVNLFDMQLAGLMTPLKLSPIWLALASDREFLKMEVRDLPEGGGGVVAAKIREIEARNPQLCHVFKKVKFLKPGIFEELSLTVGKLRLLSKNEIESIAKKLPRVACKIFSDSQLSALNFNCFSVEQLDQIIGSNESDKEVSLRREWRNPHPLDTKLLDKKTVQYLFPGFTTATLHPGYKYSVEDRPLWEVHEFTLKERDCEHRKYYSAEGLQIELRKNKEYCEAMAQNFTPEQMLALKPLMHPECQEMCS
jgi:hypothetical protein